MTEAAPEAIEAFKTIVWSHYAAHRRDLPWRNTRDPYAILVSEVMLQQTQVARVVPKYLEFLSAFPTVHSLAAAEVSDVLAAWQGLGYNRRALALQRLAAIIVRDHAGVVPTTVAQLAELPGLGHATAAAVCVYAFELPLPFVETNVRTAFIHSFFQEGSLVSDAELLPLVETTLDRENPRDWYYALMDYGSWLKRTQTNPGRRSKHHTPQSPFAGSRRQARALVLRLLLAAQPTGLDLDSLLAAESALATRGRDDVRSILAALTQEGFLSENAGVYRIF